MPSLQPVRLEEAREEPESQFKGWKLEPRNSYRAQDYSSYSQRGQCNKELQVHKRLFHNDLLLSDLYEKGQRLKSELEEEVATFWTVTKHCNRLSREVAELLLDIFENTLGVLCGSADVGIEAGRARKGRAQECELLVSSLRSSPECSTEFCSEKQNDKGVRG